MSIQIWQIEKRARYCDIPQFIPRLHLSVKGMGKKNNIFRYNASKKEQSMHRWNVWQQCFQWKYFFVVQNNSNEEFTTYSLLHERKWRSSDGNGPQSLISSTQLLAISAFVFSFFFFFYNKREWKQSWASIQFTNTTSFPKYPCRNVPRTVPLGPKQGRGGFLFHFVSQ